MVSWSFARVTRRYVCLAPFQGKHCEKCKPLFVGSAKGGGTCRPCREFCRGNSEVCLSRNEYRKAHEHSRHFLLDPSSVSTFHFCGIRIFPVSSFSHLGHSLSLYQIPDWVSEGPTEENAVCVNCQNNSLGDKCESCLGGYFLLQGKCEK